MIPSNFRIEILVIRTLLCALGTKGLRREVRAWKLVECGLLNRPPNFPPQKQTMRDGGSLEGGGGDHLLPLSPPSPTHFLLDDIISSLGVGCWTFIYFAIAAIGELRRFFFYFSFIIIKDLIIGCTSKIKVLITF